MTIEVLADVIMDECVFLASAGGKQMRKNTRSMNIGGFASVNADNDWTQRQFLLAAKPQDVEAWAEVEGVFEVTDGGTYGFLIKDPKDQFVDSSTGGFQGYMLGVEFGSPGFGNGTPDYRLAKLYQAKSSTRVKPRVITRPAGTPTLTRGGTPVVAGASPGDVSISDAPVSITFVADASQSVSAVSVGATTDVTLSTAISGFVIGGRLWLQDLTGADADLLNNQSHEITNIAGAVYTLATNTAGKTITAAGTGKKYPQPDEALAWVGSFYVPVQFATDDLDWDIALGGDFERRLVQGMAVTLIEVREA